MGWVATITAAPWRVRNTPGRGTASEVAHKWTSWLHNPCRLRVHNALERETKSESRAQVGQVAKYPLPLEWGPKASARVTKSQRAHKRAAWLHNRCRLGGPQCLGAADKIKSGTQVGRVAT